jgi:Cu-Zn family superoxide dismutase
MPAQKALRQNLITRREGSHMKKAALFAFGSLLFGMMASGQVLARTARTELRNPQGEVVGSATLTQEVDGVTISVRVSKLTPGHHAFHVHAVGKCEPPGFTSAGGHFNPTDQPHPGHAGDLPGLLAKVDGQASLTLQTDRFQLEDLFDADGSALIVHAGPDNHANIPKDRYRPDPDATTLATGDAGARVACGVITK